MTSSWAEEMANKDGGAVPVASKRFDLVIIGGGLTGLALATAVGTAGFDVLVVEQSPLTTLTSAPYDGRSTAVALGSKRLLDGIGVWEGMTAAAEPIRDILVAEAFSAIEVHYDHREVGAEPLGWIVENRAIREALLARVATLPNVRLEAPAKVAEMTRETLGATVTLTNGFSARAPLVAVCEGRFSPTRDSLGITSQRWVYEQTGIVCTIGHERPHRGLAIERFFPDGPFARLPMTGNRCSIVWALRNDMAREVTKLGDTAFTGEIADRFGADLGEIELLGDRWNYPLILVWADRYVDTRLVLVGDAARGIHPISGQGWNLALRDVAAVAEIVVDRLRLGLDPGDPVALERYAGWRRFDSLALVAITDGINRLFANDIFPLRLAREAGLAVVERVAPAKRFFMRHAMGLVGDLPRTMRGEAL